MTTAIFRFEASPSIGAGHAIRSCVVAEALIEKGWDCKVATSISTYEFINSLQRFDRIDPEEFYKNPPSFELLVVDHYGLGEVYESHFRPYVKSIFVIDDLADRKHNCDVLLDQTYRREAESYYPFVPAHCQIFVGSEYTLLRKEFLSIYSKSIEKRRQTKKINRILISMGGSDPKNYILSILEMLKNAKFMGTLDVVLGFAAHNFTQVKDFLSEMPNLFTIHVAADIPNLIYEADLAIGAAGSSVWERCYLGLPQILMMTAENQRFSFSKISDFCFIMLPEENKLGEIIEIIEDKYQVFVDKSIDITSGKGIEKIINYLQEI
jgi:UDP-2,4-diacetamido-2,4,6-trideoxy-beta-L-altropyranose hydrolase